ncbi:hypothetical protein B0A50_00458 [Salinomyces thailandicus]|uniref:DUF7730 domain-containing protein n=1 Tax=Salinomyces thailandicus TaxID=706561 RepID=A0A4U0UFE5_9PEZI|nr:hypothetical protein B0A50_00458 [Salinomyces thailandica]
MAQHAESPLMRLPPELRNQIYGLTFEGAKVNIISTLSLEKRTKYIMDVLPLLLTCRQIRKEAVEMLYAAAFLVSDSSVRLQNWLEALPPKHRKQISNVHFDAKAAAQGHLEAEDLAEWAQTMVNVMTVGWQKKGIRLPNGPTKARVLTVQGEDVWTSTPWKTYCASAGISDEGAAWRRRCVSG